MNQILYLQIQEHTKQLVNDTLGIAAFGLFMSEPETLESIRKVNVLAGKYSTKIESGTTCSMSAFMEETFEECKANDDMASQAFNHCDACCESCASVKKCQKNQEKKEGYCVDWQLKIKNKK